MAEAGGDSFGFQQSADNTGLNISSDSLLVLSQQYIGDDNEMALLYAQKAFQGLDGNDKAKISYYLIRGQVAYFNDQYDKSLLYLDSAKMFITDDYLELNADYHYHSAKTLACIGDLSGALESCQASINIRKELNDDAGVVMCENYMGTIYMKQGDSRKAGEYFNLALSKAEKDKNRITYATVISNICDLKVQQDSIKAASKLADEVYKAFLLTGDRRRIASSLISKGNIAILTGDYIPAIGELKEAELLYKNLNDKYGQTVVYTLQSKVYLALGNQKKSLELGLKADSMAAMIGSGPLHSQSLLQLSDVYEARREYQTALEYFKSYEKLNTELVSIENSKKILEIEIQSELQEREKDIELLSQKNKVNKIQKNFFRAIAFLLILISVVMFYIFRLKNKNLKQQHEILEKKNKVIEFENKIHEQNKTILENNLELKNKELASKALALLQLNESLRDIGEKISSLKNDNRKIEQAFLQKLIHEIHQSTNTNIWEEFDLAFNNVYNSFYDKLLEICPELTSSEIKIAALLKLNLSSKEIAAITYKSESAIKSVRHRLRAKLNLKKDENLIPFLLKL